MPRNAPLMGVYAANAACFDSSMTRGRAGQPPGWCAPASAPGVPMLPPPGRLGATAWLPSLGNGVAPGAVANRASQQQLAISTSWGPSQLPAGRRGAHDITPTGHMGPLPVHTDSADAPDSLACGPLHPAKPTDTARRRLPAPTPSSPASQGAGCGPRLQAHPRMLGPCCLATPCGAAIPEALHEPQARLLRQRRVAQARGTEAAVQGPALHRANAPSVMANAPLSMNQVRRASASRSWLCRRSHQLLALQAQAV